MPYKSEAQRKFFNVNRKKLESEGVDVDEWNQASKGKKLPEKKANTPGQTGNIPVTPPTAVRPEAAPSAYIPRPARRQTTLADMQGKQAMSTQKVDMPFFYLLGDLAKAAARVKVAGPMPRSTPTMPAAPSKPEVKSPFARLPGYDELAEQTTREFTAPVANTVFRGGPGRDGLGVFPEVESKPGLLSQLGQFATSPLGIGALGLGALGTGMYLGSRRKRDDDEKEAGVGSEYAGLIANPLNYIGPGQLGALAAAITPTRSLKDQVSADDEMWSNLLIPGRASYNMFKRVGSSLRSPEMLEKQREHLRKKKQQELAESAEEAGVKAATGSASEMLSLFNPLNIYGGAMLGGGAALMSPTRSLEEQAAHDAERGLLGHAADILVPGVGAYNSFKRLGSMVRSPEIKKMKAQRALKRLESEAKADEDEKEAGVRSLARVAAKSRIKQAADPTLSDKLTHYAGIPAALLGAGALTGTGVGALAHPIQELFSNDNDPEARKQRWRERLLTGAGVGTGVGLASILRHLSSPVPTYGR